ncbi:MAG: hypothetical protein A2Z38_09970 [Planctomycetes bacterium RBG_19FT_COMBO_48_8]|nr:MAG: hypothetical protein A2Z38_09970 [Planctomycetes bacterium RBG_19FT_COMBO_48_8]
MKLDNLKDHLKNKKELVPTVLLGVSVLCGILILGKVTSFFVASARAESVVKRAIEQNGTDPKNLERHLASSAAITDELKKNNLFAPPQAKQHPVKEVSGIFGDQVLIKDKWYNVGDKIADAKIVAIGPTSVTIMWDGREKSFLPIQAAIAEAPSGPRGRAATAKENEGEGDGKDEKGEGSAVTVTIQSEGGRPEFGGRGGPGEGFMAMRQRLENMSEEERQAFRDQMRERFAGGRGGPGGGRGGPGGRGSDGRR